MLITCASDAKHVCDGYARLICGDWYAKVGMQWIGMQVERNARRRRYAKG